MSHYLILMQQGIIGLYYVLSYVQGPSISYKKKWPCYVHLGALIFIEEDTE